MTTRSTCRKHNYMPRILVYMTLFVCLSACATSQPNAVPVCSIAANFDQYRGQRVMISGSVISDFRHGASIESADCPSHRLALGSLAHVSVGGREFFDIAFGSNADQSASIRVVAVGVLEEISGPPVRRVLTPERFLRIQVAQGAGWRDIPIGASTSTHALPR